MSVDDKPETMTFGIREDGTVEVDGVVIESPLLDELEPVPVEATPEVVEDERQRIEALEDIARAVARGDLVPKATPTPTPAVEDVAGYHLRASRPDWEFVNRQVSDYVALLPSEEAEAIATNHKAYNEVFDRFAAASQPLQPVKITPDRRQIDSLLQAKESRKDAARTMPAGAVNGSETFGGGHQERGRNAEITALKMKIRRNPTDTDLQAQLAKYFLGDD